MQDFFPHCILLLAGCPFLDHLTGVQHVLETWGEREEVCSVGLYHSIYGSELFVSLLPAPHRTPACWLKHSSQSSNLCSLLKSEEKILFVLLLDTCSLQQDFQLSLDQRDVVQGLIGEYAEALVYAFCTMDLASLDATLDHPPGIKCQCFVAIILP